MSVFNYLSTLLIVCWMCLLLNLSFIDDSVKAEDEIDEDTISIKVTIDAHDLPNDYGGLENADFMEFKENSVIIKFLEAYVAHERDKISHGVSNAYPESIVDGFERIINDMKRTKIDARPKLYVAYCKTLDEPIRVIKNKGFELILGWLGNDMNVDGACFRLKGDEKNVFFAPIDVKKRNPSDAVSYKFFRDEIFIFFHNEFASEFGINTRVVNGGFKIERTNEGTRSNADFLRVPTYHKADGSYHSLEVALHSSNSGVSNWLPLLVIDKNNQNIPFDDNHIIKIPSDSQPANESK